MASVLVDTSVWIDFFRAKLPRVLSSRLTELLEQQQVVVTDIIVHEILIGALTRKQYRKLQDLMSPFKSLHLTAEDSDGFNSFAWQLGKQGLLGRYTDLSIAYLSHKAGFPVLSFDRYFHRLADKGVIEVIRWDT